MRRQKNGPATTCRTTSQTKPPNDKAKPGAAGMDALPGTDAVHHESRRLGWLYVPDGLVDGPLPTHYEPVESPVTNPLYNQQTSPVYKHWKDDGNPLAKSAIRSSLMS